MNAFLIIGDPFLRESKVKELVWEIKKKTTGEIAQQSFRLSESSLENVLQTARTLPFLAERQIFHLLEAEELEKDELEQLSSYLEHPSNTTYLIFEADDFGEKEPLTSLVRTHGKVLRCKPESIQSEAAKFIQTKLDSFGKKITLPAKAKILNMCGDAIIFLDTILDRLIQYSDEKSEITEEMVDLFEENWQGPSVYKLTNALLSRNQKATLEAFRELVDLHRTDLISLMGLFHWQLRNLWQARRLLDGGISEKTVLEKCKIPKSRASYFLRDLKKFSLPKLEEAIESLYQLDRAIKTGRVAGEPGLEAWCLELSS